MNRLFLLILLTIFVIYLVYNHYNNTPFHSFWCSIFYFLDQRCSTHEKVIYISTYLDHFFIITKNLSFYCFEVIRNCLNFRDVIYGRPYLKFQFRKVSSSSKDVIIIALKTKNKQTLHF